MKIYNDLLDFVLETTEVQAELIYIYKLHPLSSPFYSLTTTFMVSYDNSPTQISQEIMEKDIMDKE